MVTPMRLGPLVCSAVDVRVESGDSVVVLSADGVRVEGPEPLEGPWTGMVRLEIIGPAAPRPADLVLTTWELLSPVAGRRSGRTCIEVQWLSRGRGVHVEPGPHAPYDYRDLDALEALVAAVGERDEWARLGDPRWLLPVMRESAAARSWLTPVTYRRIRMLVHAALD